VLSDEEFAAWFRLLETPGLNRAGVRRLLAACGSPDAVLSARPATLRELAGSAAADALASAPAEFDSRLAAALAWRRRGERRDFIAVDDPRFPPALLQTADPPLLLHVHGDPAALAARSVAIVGSRQATAQGLENARAFARALGDAGLVVVSGLALGIDGAAHEGALLAAAGPGTLAVVGTGLDRVYPSRHKALAHRISERGALVSEFAPGMPALAENFPQRNRIIAGLSLGTLVVEAALQSGSLITARMALEAGREVFAIPGSIHAPQSKGCHALLKQGAKLVESAADILDELRAAGGSAPAPSTAAGAGPTDPLLEALGFEPTTLDALLARTGWPAPALSARLLELELAGHVARLPGGLYQRCGLA
jgi:DNA processing protein